MFREIREIKVKEVSDKRKEEKPGYIKIKPEDPNFTLEDANRIFKEILLSAGFSEDEVKWI